MSRSEVTALCKALHRPLMIEQPGQPVHQLFPGTEVLDRLARKIFKELGFPSGIADEKARQQPGSRFRDLMEPTVGFEPTT